MKQIRTTRVRVMTAAAIVAAVGLGGCTGQTGGGGDKSDDATTIRYLVEQLEDADALSRLEAEIDTFEKDTGITVKVESMPYDTMRTVLQTQLRAGDGPDVISWGAGPSFGGALVEAGLLYDLTDAYEEYGWDVYPFAKEQVTFDGKTYGVPGEMESMGIFYNKDLFAEHGIAEPTTLAELDAAAATLKAAGIIPFAVSDQEGWQGGHLLSMALSSRVGSDGVEALVSGEASWDSPDVVAALQTWEDFDTKGYLTPYPTSVSYDSANALYLSGDAAMLPTGSWFVDSIDHSADFETGFIPFPAPDGPGIFAGGLGSGPWISEASTKKDAALKFVNFLASPEYGAWMVENLNVIPPFPVDTADLEASPLFEQILDDMTQLADGTKDFGVNIDTRETDDFNQAMTDGIQAIFSDQGTPADVAKQLNEAAQK